MKYPVRCRIVNPTWGSFVPGVVKNAPEESMSHIGKEGLAEEVDENVRITLDDGTILWGYDCWWEVIKAVSLLEEANELAKEVQKINKANGWDMTVPCDWELTYKIPAILALIHSEVSEALEAFRKNDRKNFDEELADILIRVLDCAAGLDIDLDKAIREKLDYNKTRGYRHGGKRV